MEGGRKLGMVCILLDLVRDLCHQQRKVDIMERLETAHGA